MCLAHLPVVSSGSLLPPWTSILLSCPIQVRSKHWVILVQNWRNSYFTNLKRLFINLVSWNWGKSMKLEFPVSFNTEAFPLPGQLICKAIWKFVVYHSILEIQSFFFPIQMWLQSLRIVTKGTIMPSMLCLLTSVLKHKMPNYALTEGCSLADFTLWF